MVVGWMSEPALGRGLLEQNKAAGDLLLSLEYSLKHVGSS